MSEDDCGATFALPVAEDLQVVPVTIDVTDDAMSAMEGAMANAENGDVQPNLRGPQVRFSNRLSYRHFSPLSMLVPLSITAVPYHSAGNQR